MLAKKLYLNGDVANIVWKPFNKISTTVYEES